MTYEDVTPPAPLGHEGVWHREEARVNLLTEGPPEELEDPFCEGLHGEIRFMHCRHGSFGSEGKGAERRTCYRS